MKFKFIVKPPLREELEREILKFKCDFEIDIELTEKEGKNSAKNLAKKAIEEGFDKIVFVGGDGIIGEGVNGIMQAKDKISKELTVGIVPTGSGNNFSKALGISKNIKEAFRIIKEGKKVSVDVGRVNESYFINCFSLGFDAKINDLANKLKEKYSFLPRDLSYLFATLKEIVIKIPNYEVKIESQEINFEGKIVLIAITNSQSYGGIFQINPEAKISDGKFNLCKILPLGKMKAFKTLFLATRGQHLKIPEVKTFLFSFLLKISAKEKIVWEIDGEVKRPQKFFEIKILPKALRFFANYEN